MKLIRRLSLSLLLVIAVAATAAAAFLYTPDLPPERLEAIYAKPPSRFVMVGGARLHISDRGPRDAPVIVLVHGLGGNLHVWSAWAEALAVRYRVVSLDLPGHGLTGPWPADDYSIERYVELIEALMAHLGIDRFVLAGHSMGGMVAWWAAAGPLRQKITGLILIDASGYPRGRVAPLGVRIARLPIVGDVAARLRTTEAMARSLRQSYADPASADDQQIVTQVTLALRAGNRAALLRRLRNFTPPDMKVIQLIVAPTLILWGENDPILGVEDARLFKRDIAGSQLILYPRTGHNPMLEQQAASAADALRFLDRVHGR